jgi:hypothetical protein
LKERVFVAKSATRTVKRFRWTAVMTAVLAGVVLAIAGASYADNLQSDLNTTTGGLDKTVNLGTLPANSARSQDVFLFVDTQPGGSNDPTYPFNVTGAKAASSTFTGSVAFDGVTLTAAGSANGKTGHVTWMTPAAQATAQSYSITENFSASTDLNTSPATVTINFSVAAVPSDTTAPTLHLPSNITAEATSAAGAVVSYGATADDANPAHPSVGCSPSSGSTFALGTTTVNCSATDGAGNTANGSFTVTVQDTTAPVVANHANISGVEATGPGGAVVTYANPSASDIVDNSLSVSCSPASGSAFELGTTQVDCSATDDAGNTGSNSFDVTVVDTAAPVVANHANITAEATGPGGAVVTYTNSASDLVDGSVAVTCSPLSGSAFALGTTTVDCSATDGAGNTGSNSFDVTVVDTTPPTLTLADDKTVEATSASGAAVSYSASASDLVDGAVAVYCLPASGSTFALGTTAVICSAADDAGNSDSGSFDVTVEDTTAPVVANHADITAEAEGPGGAVVTYTNPSASDLVDNSLSVSCSPASGSTFALGTTIVNCSATDDAGNTGSNSFDVTVQDTTAPVVANHANITAEATGPGGAVVTYINPGATDIVDGSVLVTCSPASGSTFALGTTIVNCSATDDAGNTGGNSFDVTVQDTTAPVVANHANISGVEATGPGGAVVTYTNPSASDLVDGSVLVSCSPLSGSAFALGTTTVDCSATDDAGNTGRNGFTVNVVDTTAPVVANHANITVNATGPGGAVVTYTNPSASDLVDGSVAVTCSPASGSTFLPGTTSVNCSAQDNAGNTGHGSFTVTVKFGVNGFYPPVDMTTGSETVWNIVKNGSTVPLKFEVFAGSTELTSTAVINQPLRATGVTCGLGTADDIELTATGGTSLRYDTSGGQFIYNWQTPKKVGACYLVTVSMTDGSSLSAYFKLK